MKKIEKIKKYIYPITIILIFLWYIFQISFFAIYINPCAPDEERHVYLSGIYKESGPIPFEDKPEHYKALIETPATPYMYHVAMGKLMNIGDLIGVHTHAFLRFINVIISIISFYFIYRFLRLISNDKLAHICTLGIIANTLMYLFLSGAVSYDNLTNALAIMAFFYLVKFYKYFERFDLIMLFFVCSMGALTKTTFLPLIAFIGISLIFKAKEIYENRKNLFKRAFSIKEIMALICLISIGMLDVRHYVNNIRKYGGFIVGAEVVRGENAIDGVTLEYAKLRKTSGERAQIPLLEYFLKWSEIMLTRISGIFGHKTLAWPKHWVSIYIGIIISFVSIALTEMWGLTKKQGYLTHVLLISGAYIATVLIRIYSSYLTTHAITAGVQGRYVFPVMPALVAVIIVLSFKRFSLFMKSIITIGIIFLLINGGLLFFIRNADLTWYETPW